MRGLRLYTLIGITILVLIPSMLTAGDSNSGITPELIEKMRQSTKLDGPHRAIYNALLGNDIKKLALNHDKIIEHEDLFNVTTDAKGITNQKSSGRCWLFASLNLLRPAIIKKYNLGSFEFSQNYLAFWDKMEKANMFLEIIIELRDRNFLDRELQSALKGPFGDGGWWFYTVDLIEKYGCVPKEAMPETNSSGKTGMMNKIISQKLRKSASELRKMSENGKSVAELREAKQAMLVDVYKMLTFNLGTPPTEFTWRYEDEDTVISKQKAYTPLEFYKDVVGLNLRDYVTIADHPGVEKFKMYNIRLTRNMYDKEDGKFLNLPIDSIRAYTLKMLLDGSTVIFACDVGKDNYNDKGVFQGEIYDFESVYGIDLEMSKEDRFNYCDITPNHMMLFTACDTTDGMVSKWKVENSWGTGRGDSGFWTMYNDWFDEYVFEIIVHKKYLSKDIKNLFKTEPVELPIWDPYSSYYKY